MTICKTNQGRASIYKCRNLRSNLDCNLFSHIIEISPTVSLTDAAARGKRQRSHAAAISLPEHILWIKNSIAHIQATSFSIHLSGATDRAVKPRLRAQESNSGSTSRSSTAHNKIKKEKKKNTLSLMSPEKLEWQTLERAEISACEGDSTCAYTSSVRQVLSQPLNPNWETVWDTRPRSTSPAI